MKRLFLTLTILYGLVTGYSQPTPPVTISGKLTDRNSGEAITGASVKVKKGNGGTTTDLKGSFQLPVSSLPVILVFSHVNFENQEINVDHQKELSLSLAPALNVLEGVLLVTKGIPTRITDYPSSAEFIGQTAIRQLPATSAYDATVYKKGIDLTTSSLTFKTPSSRGFNGSGSTRVNQIVDGMDNQAPGLNFFVGNFAGIPDLD
ncbi:MAG: carboxypeptidase-like regulatory domain-containing protein, partial [Chitinophagaceae bacterium]